MHPFYNHTSCNFSLGCERLDQQRHLQSGLLLPFDPRAHDNPAHQSCPRHTVYVARQRADLDTHDAFFSISGLLASSWNSKLRSKTNKITLISTSANLYPMQLRVPPRNVRRLPHTPGTWFVCSSAGLLYLSGLNSAASGPQMSVSWLMFRMAVCQWCAWWKGSGTHGQRASCPCRRSRTRWSCRTCRRWARRAGSPRPAPLRGPYWAQGRTAGDSLG